ncbi:hypothetical protein B0H11DRAFT_2210229 [Mycena galericulata]|nr:hypothetical protein B0H11DRAFT_2210229 [Mycena galericulata]
MSSWISSRNSSAAPLDTPQRLPEDLEREILEIVAFKHPETIPTLVRIARRTLLWLEPLLYRVLLLLDDDAIDRIQDRIERKPAALWRDGPRHLFLSVQSPQEFARNILSRCTGLEDLMLSCDSGRPREFLPALEAMQLRRLGVDMSDFFGGQAKMDLRGPAFSSITHLLLMDDHFGDADVDVCATQLAVLPSLTHLALVDGVPRELMLAVLERCAALYVLVNLRNNFRRHTVQFVARELGIEDPRLVILALGMFTKEWVAGAKGGEDFWVRADTFVDKKRKGEIDAATYWIDDDQIV